MEKVLRFFLQVLLSLQLRSAATRGASAPPQTLQNKEVCHQSVFRLKILTNERRREIKGQSFSL